MVPLATIMWREKDSMLGRMTTISCGTLSSMIFTDIIILTVSNMGEAFRKLSRHEALHSSAVVDNSLSVVRFGKTK